jgi:hypothetical protein
LSAIHQQKLKTLTTHHTVSSKQNITIPQVVQSNTQSPPCQKKVDEEIDLTDITRNNSTPTLISITKARREISRQLQSRVCADPHNHDHGHSYIVWSNSDWLKKRQVTSQIVPPTNPGAYGGTTHQLLEAHKAK